MFPAPQAPLAPIRCKRIFWVPRWPGQAKPLSRQRTERLITMPAGLVKQWRNKQTAGNSKRQAPEKLQASSSKRTTRFRLEFESWSFSGGWRLVLDAFSTVFFLPAFEHTFVPRALIPRIMALYNLCRRCGHRFSNSLRKCMQCGCSQNMQHSRKLLSGVFAFLAVLLIVFVFRLLS